MVDIKGLDKARVLKALYDHSHIRGSGFLAEASEGTVTVEHCAELLEKQTHFNYLFGRVLKVDLSGEGFDERLYDRDCGEGAAQRAVDSVRDEPKDGEAPSEGTAGEKKEPTMEEKVKQTKDAIEKIMGILLELSPDVRQAAIMCLRMILPGPGAMGSMASLLMLAGPFAQPMGRSSFAPSYREFYTGDDEKKEREITPLPFPFKGRFG